MGSFSRKFFTACRPQSSQSNRTSWKLSLSIRSSASAASEAVSSWTPVSRISASIFSRLSGPPPTARMREMSRCFQN